MIRHLLTLLALCAGFAAIGTPAHAVQVVEAADQVAASATASAPIAVARLIGAAPAARWVQERSRPALYLLPVSRVPTVYLQADRARE
ncbi:hypothetical protein [Croceibacterium ferulae]|uniref:hypothetical protein n=1 Tax=Croceibacterium ferulae TaxID=1854641 RepID=UPI000F86FB97|nr:hypothetical protein [Croceibacterium ferulae]